MLTAGIFVTRRVAADNSPFTFIPNSLVLSRSVYTGTAATVTVGQILPPGCVAQTVTLPVLNSNPPATTTVKVACATATANGTYPTVFKTMYPDKSFGVTSPIFLDNITTDGWLLGTLPIPSDQMVTSFSSKSELALNRLDGKSITFVGYRGGPGLRRRTSWTSPTQTRRASLTPPIRSFRSITGPSRKWTPTAIFKSPRATPTAETTAARRSRRSGCTTDRKTITAA